jgi:hypothetical protein
MRKSRYLLINTSAIHSTTLHERPFRRPLKTLTTATGALLLLSFTNITTTEVPAHVELRDIVVGAAAGRHPVFQASLQNPNNVEIFRSNVELATDLLLGGRHRSRAKAVSEQHFVCGHCHYSHAGSHICPNVVCKNVCPSCGKKSEKGVNARKVVLHAAFSCSACDEFHSMDPEDEVDF